MPALAPCIGGAVVLGVLAILVMCEMGIRWLRCDRLKCHRCRQPCRSSSVSSPSAVSSASAASDVASQCCVCARKPNDDASPRPAAHVSAAHASSASPLLHSRDAPCAPSDDDDDDFDCMDRGAGERFLTATDGDFGDLESDDDEERATGRPRLTTQELNLDYSRHGMDASSHSLSPADYQRDPKWVDFLATFGESKAPAKFAAMLEWRRTNSIDRILELPHAKFFIFKKAYPFFIHGRSKVFVYPPHSGAVLYPLLLWAPDARRARAQTGEMVTYENPGAMDLSQARIDGCTPQALRGILRCGADRKIISLGRALTKLPG